MTSATDFLQLVDSLNERVLQCTQYSDPDKCAELAILRSLLQQQVRSMALDAKPQDVAQRYDYRFMNNIIESHDTDEPLLRERLRKQFTKKQLIVANISQVIDSVGSLRRLFRSIEDSVLALEALAKKLFGDELLQQLDVQQATLSVLHRTQHNILQNFYSPLELAMIARLTAAGPPAELPSSVWSERLMLFAQGRLASRQLSSVTVLQRMNRILAETSLPWINKASHVESLLDGADLAPAQAPPNVLLQQHLERMQRSVLERQDVDRDEFVRSRRIAPGIALAKLRLQLADLQRLLDSTSAGAAALRNMVRECAELGRVMHRQACFLVCRHVTSNYSDSLADLNEGVVEDLALSLNQHVTPQLDSIKSASESLAQARLFLNRWRERHDVVKKLARYVNDYAAVLEAFDSDVAAERVTRAPPNVVNERFMTELSQLVRRAESGAREDQAQLQRLHRVASLWREWAPRVPAANRHIYDRHKIETIANERIVAGRDMPAAHLAALRRMVARIKTPSELRVSHTQIAEGQVLHVYSPDTVADLEQFLRLFLPVLQACTSALANAQSEHQKTRDASKPPAKEEAQRPNDKTKDQKEARAKGKEQDPEEKKNQKAENKEEQKDQKAENKEKQKDQKAENKEEQKDQKAEDNEEAKEDEAADTENNRDETKTEDSGEHESLAQDADIEPYMDARRTLLLLLSLAFYCDARYNLTDEPHLLNLTLPSVLLRLRQSQLDHGLSLRPSTPLLRDQVAIVHDAALNALAKLDRTAHMLLHMYSPAWDSLMTHFRAGALVQQLEHTFVGDDTLLVAAAARCEWRQAWLELCALPKCQRMLELLIAMLRDVGPFLQTQSLMAILAVQTLLLPSVTGTGSSDVVRWAASLALELVQKLDDAHIDQAMYRRYTEGVVQSATTLEAAVACPLTPTLLQTRGLLALHNALQQGDFVTALLMLVLDDLRGVGGQPRSVAALLDPDDTPRALGHGWLFAPLVWACMNPAHDNRSAVVDFVNWTWVVNSFPPVYSNSLRVTRPVMLALLDSLKQLRSRTATLQAYFEWLAEQDPQWVDLGVAWQLVALHERSLVWLYATYCCACRLSCKLLNFCGEPPQNFRVWLRTSFVSPTARQLLEPDFVFE